MLTPTRGPAAEAFDATPRTHGRPRTNPDESTTSFAQQLAGSLDAYLKQVPAGSQLEFNISPQTNPDSGTRQFLVTVKAGNAATPAAALPNPGAVLDVTAMMMYSGTPAVSAAAEVAPPPPPSRDEADAYWAMQPKEVQVLRTIQDEAERYEVGKKLAQQGFSIDTHIMLNWWDPYMTMKIRAEEGYTWIPALGQGGAMNRPGFSSSGLAGYDALNPPPGSIRVSTDFAKGLEHTSPGGRTLVHSAGS